MKIQNAAPIVKLHAKYSASGSERWLNCAGSIALSEKAPPSKSSKAADEGTEAHSCLEFLVKNRLKREASVKFLLKKYPPEMVAHAEDALDYIEARAKELGAEILCEIRADLPVDEKGQFGTSDIVLLTHFGRLVVIDYKYGQGVQVYPKKNSQLIYYGLGVAHLYDYNFSEVELVVIQPRGYMNNDPIRTWETTVEELIEWRDVFNGGIKKCKVAAKTPEKYLKSGKHCKFCPAQVLCPELKNKALRDAQADFDDESGEISLPTNKALIPNLEVVLPALDRLETWIESVRKYAFEYIEDGGAIRGYDLVPTKAQRQWENAEEVEAKILKKFGNSMKFFKPTELLSPAQFEKLGEKHKAFVSENTVSISSGKKLGESKAAKDFEGFTEGGIKTVNASKVKQTKKTKVKSRVK